MTKPQLVTWDWKEQPDVERVARALAEVSGGAIYVYDVDTQSDQFAWVIASGELTPDEVAQAYRSGWDDES
jgi:hypothetical protein